ncbi:type II toxin-antitoxin system HicA family toxin [Campylobacter jejuni]|uniref:Type II toxin-antitoxin system HicA family toxin n=1 Tax=Campylobacter jejuni TaxID=197 RepID=A0A431G5R5_CAMJU|nr:type II toxin-antitoxin system HicA family toxin [Campylobacter jejuni]EAL1765206.1 type II toxin-antitoxin system HicA family toxin [Campylobacter jejuni]ECL3020268.1 type II toxin-antitoxin system HicA family toxin [Campylobacter jejuni]ECO6469614.1 type II toxin-antitoxin system HicA family toxin [Campylobacter jejuni]EIA7118831.1 type II toxin-antitoxin system HicA family toxin [Campylobacter jejuni]EID0148449.1 type II toxin-antitoxin system HicA family toxin [Campylobacter jejuni]
MSKKDKIIKDLKNNPNNVPFETLKILLESEGYECFNKGGSHYQFRKEECDLITIPFKRPIKAIYVKMVLKAITGE